MDELLNDTSEKLFVLEESIQKATELVERFLEAEPKEEGDVQKAGWYTTIAYALGSLSFSLLKMHGLPVKGHPVKAELDRIKKYFDKISRFDSNAPVDRASLQVDQAAAKRIVSHYTSSMKPKSEKSSTHIKFDETTADNASSTTESKTTDQPSDEILGKAAAFLEQIHKDMNANSSNTPKKKSKQRKRKSQPGTPSPATQSPSSESSPSKKAKKG